MHLQNSLDLGSRNAVDKAMDWKSEVVGSSPTAGNSFLLEFVIFRSFYI